MGESRVHPELWRLEPLSREFGGDRGTPLDRYYIAGWLARNASDVRGRVLEVGDNIYTRRFGGRAVTTSDVVYLQPGKPGVTIVADLRDAPAIPSRAFDCVILTQTLHLIDNIKAVLATVHRVLEPGGVCLASLPGISQISSYDAARWGDHWRFTPHSARKLFSEAFVGGAVAVESMGNVLSACGFLQGIATHELTRDELDFNDADYPLVVAVRAARNTVA